MIDKLLKKCVGMQVTVSGYHIRVTGKLFRDDTSKYGVDLGEIGYIGFEKAQAITICENGSVQVEL